MNPTVHRPGRRRSIRLQHHDYSQSGAYYVTLCAEDRTCLFGEVAGGEVRLGPAGRIVAETWQWLGSHYPGVDVDAWIVMPNHLHGILWIDAGRRDSQGAPSKGLGQLIGAFKTVSTQQINVDRGTPAARVWQRNYFEHVIRTEASLVHIRRYIAENPARWEIDRENPHAAKPESAEAWRVGGVE